MGLSGERGSKTDLCVSATTLAVSETWLTEYSLQYGIEFATERGF